MRREHLGPVLAVVTLGAVLGIGAFFALGYRFGTDPEPPAAPPPVITTTSTTSTTSTTTTTTIPPSTTTSTTMLVREPNTIPSWTVGEPWGSVQGVTMFRGNPTRTFYGTGPISGSPEIAWTYPNSRMCAMSSVGGESRQWCGMGWTGQPVVYDREDGITELIFGAYDRAVHFLDADTGEPIRERFITADIIKGSVTLDPDGYPLIYFGSRDNKLRVVAFDREVPTELFDVDAYSVSPVVWNNDWDGNPVVVDDIMYIGGENSWFFAYELNRGYDTDGMVTVEPRRLLAMPGFTDELIRLVGRNVSIESSPVVYEQRVYFTNSGGRVVGLDVSDIRSENAPIVFDYWAGGDIDATPLVDGDGYLYIGIEWEPHEMGSAEQARNREVGQLVKLDPYTSGDPRVWGVDLIMGSGNQGIWATPALHEGHLYVNTQHGDLIAVDTDTGEVVWSERLGWHNWSSPVVVDNVLIAATCSGDLHAYSVVEPSQPRHMWTLGLGGACLEATPVVWNGAIYIGSRDGYIRGIR